MKKIRVKKDRAGKRQGLGKLRQKVRRLKKKARLAGGNGKGKGPGPNPGKGKGKNPGGGKDNNCMLSVKLQGQASCNKITLTLSRNGSVVEAKPQCQVPSNVVFRNLTQGAGYTLLGHGAACSGSESDPFSVGSGNNKVTYRVS